MVDTCITTQKYEHLLIEHIQCIAVEKGWTSDNIKIFEGNYLQHLQNAWFGAVTKQLSKTLAMVFEDDLGKILLIICMLTEIDDLLQCIEKEFSLTAN